MKLTGLISNIDKIIFDWFGVYDIFKAISTAATYGNFQPTNMFYSRATYTKSIDPHRWRNNGNHKDYGSSILGWQAYGIKLDLIRSKMVI